MQQSNDRMYKKDKETLQKQNAGIKKLMKLSARLNEYINLLQFTNI